MGSVYRAQDSVLKRTVALKFINEHCQASPEGLARFFQEAQAVAQLAHPNIVTLYGIHPGDTPDQAPFIEMEWIDGTTLADLLSRQGRLDVWQAREYVRIAALGLQHAHEKGLVHRDIKPANLFVTGTAGPVKILDLGLARLALDTANTKISRSGSVLGTVDYMAPEQADDARAVDIRADLYGLGCTFYHALTGQVPFPSGNVFKVLMSHQKDTAVPVEKSRPDLPPQLALLKPSTRWRRGA